MYSTKVTKLKKKNGASVYNYDVYIGPALVNSHWDLECSIWCNPYNFGRASKAKERLECYKRDVIDKQKPEMLRQLQGEMLGCMCLNTLTCHGHLLAKLAQGEKELTENVHRCWTCSILQRGEVPTF